MWFRREHQTPPCIQQCDQLEIYFLAETHYHIHSTDKMNRGSKQQTMSDGLVSCWLMADAVGLLVKLVTKV